MLQYGPEDNRPEYQYSTNNYNNNSGGVRTLYHHGIVNNRDPAHVGWKLQRNQPQLSSIDSRVLQVNILIGNS